MNAQSNQAKTLFLKAIEDLSPPEWPAYLDEVCAGQPELRRCVEELLEAHQKAGTVMKPESGEGSSLTSDNLSIFAERPGSIIGSYKLLEKIGEGGFGVVFMAEQQHPVRRKVALKVLKPGMDSHQVIARFEAERQALALMDHPNIARVLDGGQTSTCRPYFVMDLVKGLPITEFCDQSQLTTRERLELFVHVCQAVQHAHQKGIIHRDLKPSNILVTLQDGSPLVKVIDFGIAKVLGQHLTEKTLFTGFAQLIGTPMYMAPEQAALSNVDADTRSDIYSLGVLLYELLTGTTPFDKKRLQQADYDEMRRIIREEEPPKPSTRISTLAQKASSTTSTQRKSDPKRLSQLFRGELDWIVMKCLEKDRNRRYETANGLGMDVMRYLADETVHACPPSTAYRLSKFYRKYRSLIRVVALFVVFLILAAAVSTWQAIRATIAKGQAETAKVQAEAAKDQAEIAKGQAEEAKGQALTEKDKAEASFRLARDAVDKLFTQVSQNPKLKSLGMENFRKELLNNAKDFNERFIKEHFDSPGVRNDLALAHRKLGEIHRELGDYKAAEESFNNAVTILTKLAQEHPNSPDYLRDMASSYVGLGLAFYDNEQLVNAEKAYQQAQTIQETLVKANPNSGEYRFALAKTLSLLGLVRHRNDATEAAENVEQKAHDILNSLIKDFPRVHDYLEFQASIQMDLGQAYLIRGLNEKAWPPLKEAREIYSKIVHDQQDVPADLRMALAQCTAMLGMASRDRPEREMARKYIEEGQKMFEQLASEHPEVNEYAYGVGRSTEELARCDDRDGKYQQAVEKYDKAIALMDAVLKKGFSHAQGSISDSRINRAATVATMGDHKRATSDAETVFREGNLLSVHIYNIACVFSRSVPSVDKDAKLTADERKRLKAIYSDRAIYFLRQAVAKGYLYAHRMRVDSDLNSIREREDFQKIVADLEKAVKNKSGL